MFLLNISTYRILQFTTYILASNTFTDVRVVRVTRLLSVNKLFSIAETRIRYV